MGLYSFSGYQTSELRKGNLSVEQIVLNGIRKENNRITYDFTCSEGLKQFYTGEPFFAEYQENVEEIPDAVAAIPFVGAVMPLVWVSHAELRIPELDSDFYECLPELRKGYGEIFPETEFSASLQVKKLVPSAPVQKGKAGVMFSGGLDAVNTLISHIDEQPDLITIWGADIPCRDEESWKKFEGILKTYRDRFALPGTVIRSSLRIYEKERQLDAVFHSQLQDGWWHGMKHGIAMLALTAPYCYLHGLDKLYIASSFTKEDEPVRCASDPKTDNHVRFCGVQVCHDGYEFHRQDKVHNVVSYVNITKKPMNLHVCWESRAGYNCCRCEKCYRTMVSLLAEGADPRDYGFPDMEKTMKDFRWTIVHTMGKDTGLMVRRWKPIQKTIEANQKLLRKNPYWKDIRWLLYVDFQKPETVQMSCSYRIREKLGDIPAYKKLSQLKAKILGEEVQ